MLPGPDIAPDRQEELEIAPAAEPQPDAAVASPERDPMDDAAVSERDPMDDDAAPEWDPAHLGHGVHAHGDDGGGMHVGETALPGPSRTGAGLGGLQIGDTRF